MYTTSFSRLPFWERQKSGVAPSSQGTLRDGTAELLNGTRTWRRSSAVIDTLTHEAHSTGKCMGLAVPWDSGRGFVFFLPATHLQGKNICQLPLFTSCLETRVYDTFYILRLVPPLSYGSFMVSELQLAVSLLTSFHSLLINTPFRSFFSQFLNII
jgi:hypothetical protein